MLPAGSRALTPYDVHSLANRTYPRHHDHWQRGRRRAPAQRVLARHQPRHKVRRGPARLEALQQKGGRYTPTQEASDIFSQIGGVDRAASDLNEVGERAARRGLRIGSEALAWGRHINDYRDAWKAVRRADHTAVGLVLDSFHALARKTDLKPIVSIPPTEKCSALGTCLTLRCARQHRRPIWGVEGTLEQSILLVGLGERTGRRTW